MFNLRLVSSILLFASLSSANASLLQVDDITEFNEYTERPSEKEVREAQIEVEKLSFSSPEKSNRFNQQFIFEKYHYVDRGQVVPDDLLSEALNYFDANSGFENREYITIVDYSQPSWRKRLFVINMKDGSVHSRHVGHGRYSDPDHDGYLDYYSNVLGSNKSSKGFYRAAEIYWSSNVNIGRALKLDGLSSTNSNARSRGIVFHGSNYVSDENVIQGRSLGCVTISWKDKDELIDLLSGGSLLYVNNSNL